MQTSITVEFMVFHLPIQVYCAHTNTWLHDFQLSLELQTAELAEQGFALLIKTRLKYFGNTLR